MTAVRVALLGISLGLASGIAAGAAIIEPSMRVEPLIDELQRVGKSSTAIVGVAAWRLDGRGPRVELNAGQRFPMASTFKVAVAATVLARVDAGDLALGQMVTIDPAKYVDSEVIAAKLIHPGVALSVENLIELMLTESDNTAANVLTELAGGPAAVTRWLAGQGITAQSVDRDTEGLLRDYFGLPAGPVQKTFEDAAKHDPTLLSRGELPNPAFDDDPRDTSTPIAMADLLTRIFRGAALSPDSTHVIVATMERCSTGATRLKGLLPEGTIVAHKTGTIGGTINDVGVITLPGDVGQVVIAVFIKKSADPVAHRERTIAEISRLIRDYFLFAHPLVQ